MGGKAVGSGAASAWTLLALKHEGHFVVGSASSFAKGSG
jgi:hypothetical protein